MFVLTFVSGTTLVVLLAAVGPRLRAALRKNMMWWTKSSCNLVQRCDRFNCRWIQLQVEQYYVPVSFFNTVWAVQKGPSNLMTEKPAALRGNKSLHPLSRDSRRGETAKFAAHKSRLLNYSHWWFGTCFISPYIVIIPIDSYFSEEWQKTTKQIMIS